MQHAARFISSAARSLAVPSEANRVVLNYWSPGYKIYREANHSRGRGKRKVFVPTSTFQVALAHLKQTYGEREYLKFKDDIHPGHISLETHKHYFSVGTMDEIDGIRLDTKHRLVYTDSLREEVLSFRRYPERRIDFYVLRAEDIDTSIPRFRESEIFYSLLGKRFGFAEGESCTTAVYCLLEISGIEGLLLPHQHLIGRHSVLSPASLMGYLEDAKKEELSLFAKSAVLTKSFSEQSDTLGLKMKEEIDRLYAIEQALQERRSDVNGSDASYKLKK